MSTKECKQNKCGMRGKFAKCEPKGGASPIPNTGMEGKFPQLEASPSKRREQLLPLRLHSPQPTFIKADRHPSNMIDGTLMERHQIDDSRCYFCSSEDKKGAPTGWYMLHVGGSIPPGPTLCV